MTTKEKFQIDHGFNENEISPITSINKQEWIEWMNNPEKHEFYGKEISLTSDVVCIDDEINNTDIVSCRDNF